MQKETVKLMQGSRSLGLELRSLDLAGLGFSSGMVNSSSISEHAGAFASAAGWVINEEQLGPAQVYAQPDKAQSITVKL